jgi:hypothetical protein
MNDLQQAVGVKLECADYIRKKIISLCKEQCEIPQPITLAKIGSFLGIFATTLRSILNYTLIYYKENRLGQRINFSPPNIADQNQFGKLNELDFPWVEGQSDKSIKSYFDKNKNTPRHKFLKLMQIYDPIAFDFLQKSQPFHHPDNKWLWHLMVMSNTDKHKFIIKNKTLEVIPINPHLRFDEDKILISNEKGKIKAHKLPFYDSTSDLFVSTKRIWSFFLFTIYQNDPPNEPELPLIKFINDVPDKVKKTAEDFYTLPLS